MRWQSMPQRLGASVRTLSSPSPGPNPRVTHGLGAFLAGWAQNTARGTVVGEARCAKPRAPKLKEWLARGPDTATVTNLEVKDYENTKIKLHFSHFKILPDERVTCFRDLPHQCPEFSQAAAGDASSGTGAPGAGHTEL